MKAKASIFLNLALSLLWGWFAYVNLTVFFLTRDPASLLFVLSQTELVILFLLRKPALSSSEKPLEYIAAFLGTFLVLLYRPLASSEAIFSLVGSLLIYIAVILEILGAWWLGRSYGIVPANRGVKTRGLYMFVRHPIYLGSLCLYLGYVLMNPSLYNGTIVLAALIFQILRIQAEERLLMQDAAYVSYAEKVRWRLVPGLY